jgi:biopolymer transport protein ExbD
MKIRTGYSTGDDGRRRMPMTPMIDIVFQLLVFFLLTFRIVTSEGDFHVRMPRAPRADVPAVDQLPPLTVRLIAGEQGEVSQIKLNDRSLGTSFEALRRQVIDLVDGNRSPDRMRDEIEVELDCDHDLDYGHVIDAITAVSGYVDENGNQIELVERIRFARPRAI